MPREVHRLFSHTLLTSIGSIAQGAIVYLALPLYTRHLSPDAFGRVELLAATMTLASMVFMLGLPSAVAFRLGLVHAADRERRAESIATAMAFVALSTATFAIASVLFAPALARSILGGQEHAPLVIVAATGVVANGVIQTASWILRGLYRTPLLTALVLLGSVVNVGVASALILGAGMTFESLIYGSFAGQAVTALGLLVAVREQLVGRSSLAELRAMLAYGVPLLIGGASFYLLQVADRWLLRWYLDEASVGLYAIGVRFASILQLAVFTPFLAMWGVAVYDIGRRPDAARILARFTTRLLGAGSLLVVGLAFFVEIPMRLLLDPRFLPAEAVVGPLALGYLLFTLSEVLKAGILIEGRTRLLPARVALAGIANVALATLMIPRLGMHGAAFAAVLASAGLCALTYWPTRRFYPVPYEARRLLAIAGLLLAAALVYAGTALLPIALRFAARSAAFAAFAIVLFSAGIVDWREALALVRGVLRRGGGARSDVPDVRDN